LATLTYGKTLLLMSLWYFLKAFLSHNPKVDLLFRPTLSEFQSFLHSLRDCSYLYNRFFFVCIFPLTFSLQKGIPVSPLHLSSESTFSSRTKETDIFRQFLLFYFSPAIFFLLFWKEEFSFYYEIPCTLTSASPKFLFPFKNSSPPSPRTAAYPFLFCNPSHAPHLRDRRPPPARILSLHFPSPLRSPPPFSDLSLITVSIEQVLRPPVSFVSPFVHSAFAFSEA